MNQRETVAGVTAIRTPLHTFLLVCGLLTSVYVIVSYLILGVITPGYDMLRQPIGDLQLTANGWIQSINFIVVGFLNIAFAAGLRKELRGGFGAFSIPLFYVGVALGLFIGAMYTRGTGHDMASLMIFISGLITFLLFARRFKGDTRWKGWSSFTTISAVLIVLLLSIYGYEKNSGGAYAGIFERLAIVMRLVWAIPFIMALLDGRRLTQAE